MADDKPKQPEKKEDPRIAAARERAAAMSRSGEPLTLAKSVDFFKSVGAELKKTTWPDRTTLTKSTGIVLAFIGLTALWVGLLEFLFRNVAPHIFKT